MGWISPFISFTVLFSGFICTGFSAAVDSSPDTALRFAQCMIQRVAQSPFFSEEDTENLIVVTDVMAAAMHDRAIPPKIVMDAFATSMSDIVIGDNAFRNLQRKAEYSSDLEQCSIAVTGFIDTPFINEALRLVSVLERAKSVSAIDEPQKLQPSLRMPFPHQTSKQIFSPLVQSVEFSDTSIVSLEGSMPRLQGSVISDSSRIIPQVNQKRSQNSFGASLEDILESILRTSPTFVKVFRPGINQQDAIRYARGIISAGLADFNPVVINEALQAVTNAISLLPSNSTPEDYAFSISRSISSVLELHDLYLFADAQGIARVMILRLDSMPGRQLPSVINKNMESGSVLLPLDSITFTSQGVPNQQPSVVISEPSNILATQFQNELNKLLTESDAIANVFCSNYNPTEISQTVFRMIKRALVDLGVQISTIIATDVTNSVAELSPEYICGQYALTISKGIADNLLIRRLLDSCDATIIKDRMSSSLRQSTGLGSMNVKLQIPEQTALGSEDFSQGVPRDGIKIPLDFQTEVRLSGQEFINPSQNGKQIMIPEETRPNDPILNLRIALENALVSSESFLETFNPSTTSEDAATYATLMAREALSEYGAPVVEDVVTAVRDAMSDLPPGSSSTNYASSLVNSIITILNMYGLTTDIQPEFLASTMLFTLDSEIQQVMASGDDSFTETYDFELYKEITTESLVQDVTDQISDVTDIPSLDSAEYIIYEISPKKNLHVIEDKSSGTVINTTSDATPVNEKSQIPKNESSSSKISVDNVSETSLNTSSKTPISGITPNDTLAENSDGIVPQTDFPHSLETYETISVTPPAGIIIVYDATESSYIANVANNSSSIETTTIAPDAVGADAVIDVRKLSKVLMEESNPILKASNVTDDASSNQDVAESENLQEKEPSNPESDSGIETHKKPPVSDVNESTSPNKGVELTNNSEKEGKEEKEESAPVTSTTATTVLNEETYNTNSPNAESLGLPHHIQTRGSTLQESSNIEQQSVTPIMPSVVNRRTISAREPSGIILEPSFWIPNMSPSDKLKVSYSGNVEDLGVPLYDYYSIGIEDPAVIFAKDVSALASSSIAYLKSPDYNLYQLCDKLNDIASLVSIPPIRRCTRMAMVEFLLYVVKAITLILKGV